jgi:hypothetical protein
MVYIPGDTHLPATAGLRFGTWVDGDTASADQSPGKLALLPRLRICLNLWVRASPSESVN